MINKSFCLMSMLLVSFVQAQQITIRSSHIQRILSYDGKVWRTTEFLSADNQIKLKVKSEEVNILPMDSAEGLSISDFQAIGKPEAFTKKDSSFLIIRYKPLSFVQHNPVAPQQMIITYYAARNDDFIRKKILLIYNKPATVDRLEVERFISDKEQSGGGRGEPVFIDNRWFTGLEYPGGYSRRTDGNSPKSYGRYYDTVGNYSYIDLEGRDIEPHAQRGLVRLMHFPGYAIKQNSNYVILSKTAVTGYAKNNMDIRQAFMQYLSTIWKKPRSFVNYNNWFDKSAKNLKGDTFINVYKRYKAAIAPYGIKIDAMVPDDGWQDKNSIWKPSPAYFPNGDSDLILLSRKLQKEGTHLGLWLAINGYGLNTGWGVKNGYAEAGRNKYFGQYGRYYSLSATKYKNEILKRIPELAKEADLIYFKHDFNDLSDLSDGNNHPPTDRHGHEANLDVELQALAATRKVKPDIFQNLTNWVWMSPWWLEYADYLWMLAGDDGINGNTPELSEKAMFTTDRDTYIWRIFGNPADRPLVPISRLMTHGILQTSVKEKNISLQDWSDYVVMHYGRGTLLKEWYISLDAMRPELWQALAGVQKWAQQHEAELDNTVFVGGRPDEGNAYGYIGWKNDKAVLTARNTGPEMQTLVIPFNKEIGFYGHPDEKYKACVQYPYQEIYPATFTSGKNIEVRIPGYSTMVFEFEKGKAVNTIAATPSSIRYQTDSSNAQLIKTAITIPGDVKGRCDLLVIGYPDLPVITIDGQSIGSQKTTKALLNHFASYAISGMKSSKVTDWKMAGYDLLPYTGKKIEIVYTKSNTRFESYILAEQKVKTIAAQNGKDLLPIKNDVRRQTIKLY